MLNRLLATAPLASALVGVELLDQVSTPTTTNLILQVVIAAFSLVTTWLSHKKISQNLEAKKPLSDTIIVNDKNKKL